MADRKVVTIEDRIPTLKEQRKKRANRRLILYLSIFFLLILTVVYFQSPLSHISQINVEGNEFADSNEVLQYSSIQENDHLWNADLEEAAARIETLPTVEQAELTRNWPNTVTITIVEDSLMAFLRQGDRYVPILSNGQLLTDEAVQHPSSEAPVLYNWEDVDILREFTAELAETGDGIVNRISEIHHIPSEDKPFALELVMNDGLMVHTEIADFAEAMEPYPALVNEIDPEEAGVLHMGMSPYFESYEDDEENEEQGEQGVEEGGGSIEE
ncbi:cell division protein FtsQ/DivIB [Salsuginibacillus kocurii]|uniref:cell division protein FtsQ/DivIB n=1 Tax=Salsuginibacillus kocurii TaxID=427078 RepID=UPI00035FB4AD|nr:FtsQ-type POTRA domain-containing protein [Salsuginibacillus kocurii]